MADVPARGAVALAVEAYQRGQLDVAAANGEAVLARDPRNVTALQVMGFVRFAQGQHEQALDFARRAIAASPDDAGNHGNLGLMLLQMRRLAEALAAYDAALALDPRLVRALYNRANILRDLGRADETVTAYGAVLAVKPDHADALIGRGNALLDQGSAAEALADFERAAALTPVVGVFLGRGNALLALLRPADALQDYDRALALDPQSADAHYNRGNALRALGRGAEAAASYDAALAYMPDHKPALFNRGVLREEQGRTADALADFERVMALDPAYEYAHGMAWFLRQHTCDWRDLAAHAARLEADVAAERLTISPFAFLGISPSPAHQLTCARVWARRQGAPAPLWRGETYRHEKIRLAYVSADFRDHAVAYLIAGLFEQHDRARFETVALSFGPEDRSPMRARIAGAVDRFVDARGKTDAAIAQMLREQEIDIAIDLLGFTTHSRPAVFAHRAAPLQVNYLGYPGTMGADFIDYLIADRYLIPPAHRAAYAEKIVTLPDAYQANDDRRAIAERTPSRADAGLPARGFVFCCFNNNYKILPPVFDIWMRLLRAVDGSVLWLLQDNAAAAANLRREAAARGVAPDRLIFAPRVPSADHLARQRLGDLFLDTSPYAAHTTASDALWAGLPLVTCPGETFASRVAASLLRAAGLPELIAGSWADYEALALKLAHDADALSALKAKLAAQRGSCALFDTARFCRHIEAAYRTMWERQQRHEPPADFVVTPV